MINQAISKDMKVTRVNAAAVAATTDLDGTTILDMAGFDAVIFIALLGDVTNTSVLSLEGRESVNSDGSSDSLIAGSKTDDFTASATSADNKVIMSDTVRPTKRYVFPKLRRGTANAVVDGVLAIQYRGDGIPVSQPATVIAAALAHNY